MRFLLTISAALCLLGSISFAQPRISGFSPSKGAPGETLTITGSGFSPTAFLNRVTFGDVSAVALAVDPTGTSMTVTVPNGAPLASIKITDGGLTGISAQSFIPTYSGARLSASVFGTTPTYSSALQMYGGAVADLDLDGDPDVIGPTEQDLRQYVILPHNGNRGGNPSFGLTEALGSGITSDVFVLEDFNGDGLPDLAAPESDRLAIYQNFSSAGGIAFNLPQYDSSLASGSSSAIVARDFNVDGRIDIAVLHSGQSRLYVFENTSSFGSLSFNLALNLNLDAWFQLNDMDAADFNEDGLVDIVIQDGFGDVLVYQNTSSAGISFFPGANVIGQNVGGVEIMATDFSDDGIPDIVSLSARPAAGLVLFRNETLSNAIAFGAGQTITTASSEMQAMDVGDMDGDGLIDVVIADSTDLYIYPNESALGAIALGAPVSQSMGLTRINNLVVRDMDFDQRPDINVFADFTEDFRIVLNNNPLSSTCPDPFTVSTFSDNGTCGSLRFAIDSANALSGHQTITFEGLSSPGQILLSSPLPTITDSLTIDATTYPGYVDRPNITLVEGGASLALSFDAGADGSTVKGLNFQSVSTFSFAVQVQNVDSFTVQQCSFGTDTSLTSVGDAPNFGVIILGGSGHVVGGLQEDRNWFAGMGTALAVSQTEGVELGNNFFGMDIDGDFSDTLMKNNLSLSLAFSSRALIHDNIICGGMTGINLNGNTNTQLLTNYIGSTENGNSTGTRWGPATAGITAIDCDSLLLEENLIASIPSTGVGANIQADSLFVYGNRFGTSRNGANSGDDWGFMGDAGLEVYNSSYVTIGASGNANRNTFGRSVGTAMRLSDVKFATVQNSLIGVNLGGTTAGTGFEVRVGLELNHVDSSLIGGTDALGDVNTMGNITKTPGGIAMYIHNGSTGNTIVSNRIGVRKNGTATNTNMGAHIGILLDSCENNVFGDLAEDGANVIANCDSGFVIRKSNRNLIEGNRIGVFDDDDPSAMNGAGLVFSNASSNNSIVANTISNCPAAGVLMPLAVQDFNRLTQNRIFCNAAPEIDLNGSGNGGFLAPTISSSALNFTQGTAQPLDTVELFYNGTCGSIGGDEFVGSFIADASGNWSFDGPLKPGRTLVATATNNLRTSPFSDTLATLPCDTFVVSYLPDESVCGSLRFAVELADGDTITFNPALAGDTIKLDDQLDMDGHWNVLDGDVDGDGLPDVIIWDNGNSGDEVNIVGNNNLIKNLNFQNFSTSTNRAALTFNGDSNQVVHCYFGTSLDGLTAGSRNQISVTLFGAYNKVGDGTLEGANTICGGNRGVNLSSANSHHNIVAGNFIGLNAQGTEVIPILNQGLQLQFSANNNLIGDSTASFPNYFAGAATNVISTVSAFENRIENNVFGTNLPGDTIIASTRHVYTLGGSEKNVIGGPNQSARNTFVGATSSAIHLTTDSNTVQGNYIGFTPDGLTSSSNTVGIQIVSSYNTIGGEGLARNYVGGNDDVGIRFISSSSADSNFVVNNVVGLFPDEVTPAPNGSGVEMVLLATYNTFTDNIIAFSQENGVLMRGVGINRNRFIGNSIYANQEDAIDIETNAQEDVLPPRIDGIIGGLLSGTAAPGATIHVFADSLDEAQFPIDSVTADASGLWSIDINGYTLPAGLDAITVLQDSSGNASVLTTPVPYFVGCSPLLVTSTADDSTCGTLRYALGYTSTNAGAETIVFDLQNDTILLEKALQILGDPGTIVSAELEDHIAIQPSASYSSSLDGDMIEINASDMTFEGLELIGFLKGDPTQRVNTGIQSDENGGRGDNLTLKSMEVHGFGGLGMSLKMNGNVVENCLSYDNLGAGISIDETADQAVVRGSGIGSDSLKTSAATGSQAYGIVSLGTNVLIGGDVSGDENVIVDGDFVGIWIASGSADVYRNFVGLGMDTSSAVPNKCGILVTNGADANMGNGNGEGANIIAFNEAHGVLIDSASTARARIRRNLIYGNGAGIVLRNGANDSIQPPSVGGINAEGELFGTSRNGARIDVFADDSTQGRVYLGTTSAGDGQDWVFDLKLVTIPSDLQFITTVQTSIGSSEFSDPLQLADTLPPVAFAGNDTTVFFPDFTLQANDPGFGETGRWIDPAALVTFDDTTSGSATVSDLDPVNSPLILIWELDDGQFTSRDTVVLTIVNSSPTVLDTGFVLIPDSQTFFLPFDDFVADPEGNLNYSSVQVLDIGGALDLAYFVENSADSLLEITIPDTIFSPIFDSIQVEVCDVFFACDVQWLTMEVSTTPVVFAGNDTTAFFPSLTLGATPPLFGEIVFWSDPSGTLVFDDSLSPTATVSGLNPEDWPYELIWTVDDGVNAFTDTLLLSVINSRPEVRDTSFVFFPDSQTVALSLGVILSDGEANLDFNTVQILDIGGALDLAFFVVNSVDSLLEVTIPDTIFSTVEDSIQVLACDVFSDCDTGWVKTLVSTSLSADAGLDFTIRTDSTNLAAALPPAGFTGTWSVLPPWDVEVDLDDVNDPLSRVSGFSPLTGTYEFVWTVSNGSTTAFDTVEIAVLNSPPTFRDTTLYLLPGDLFFVSFEGLIADSNGTRDLSDITLVEGPLFLSSDDVSIDGLDGVLISYDSSTVAGIDTVGFELCDFSGDCALSRWIVELESTVIPDFADAGANDTTSSSTYTFSANEPGVGTTGTWVLPDASLEIDSINSASATVSGLSPLNSPYVFVWQFSNGETGTFDSLQLVVLNTPPVLVDSSFNFVLGQGVETLSWADLMNDENGLDDLSSVRIIDGPFALDSDLITVDSVSETITFDLSSISFVGQDSVQLEVCDLSGDCDSAFFKIAVAAPEDLTGEVSLRIFEAISPNGDGAQDFLDIRFVQEGLELLSVENHRIAVTIIDMWSNEVFKTDDFQSDSWPSQSDLNDFAPGPHFYVIQHFENDERIKLYDGLLFIKF